MITPYPFSGCLVWLGSLKPLQNLQPMERQRLADIFPINKHVESHLATSRRRSILGFRLPYGVGLGSLKLIFVASKMLLHGGKGSGLITAGKRV